MATSSTPPISFELPLYRNPSGNLRKFFENVNKHQMYCTCTFGLENGFKVLRFVARIEQQQGGIETTATAKTKAFLADNMRLRTSYKPEPKGELHMRSRYFFEKAAGNFASKFYAGMSYAEMEASAFRIEFIEKENLPEEDYNELMEIYLTNMYGLKDVSEEEFAALTNTFAKDVFGIMRVTFYCNEVTTRNVLANFFAILDAASNTD